MIPRLDVPGAARLVRYGGVIAYPTEAVYGLGCDPANTPAVERILAAKSRPEEKGLILAAGSIDQLLHWMAPLPKRDLRTLEASWPGHTTWVVPAREDCPAVLTGGRDTLAVRVSAHPVVRALCEALDHALVSTSANRSGEPAIVDQAALDSLTGIDAVVLGAIGGAERPSQIFRLRDGARLR